MTAPRSGSAKVSAPDVPHAQLLPLIDPKVAAVGLSLEVQPGQPRPSLEKVTGEEDGHKLVFWVANLPADFLVDLAADRITVSGAQVVANMERLLALIRQAQGRRIGR